MVPRSSAHRCARSESLPGFRRTARPSALLRSNYNEDKRDVRSPTRGLQRMESFLGPRGAARERSIGTGSRPPSRPPTPGIPETAAEKRVGAVSGTETDSVNGGRMAALQTGSLTLPELFEARSA